MSIQNIKSTLLFRRGTQGVWKLKNPVLLEGEPGFETDTHRLKIGDGVTPWNELSYFGGGGASFTVDGNSITILDDGDISLYGFNGASTEQIPSKGEDGKLTWIDGDKPIPESDIREIIK